jgi:hypothetical protein
MVLNYKALREITGTARRHLTVRRAWTWLGFALAFVSLRTIVSATRWLDDRLWPEISEQRIEQPVFIFANARSGTTLLHRLMSLDERRFATMKLYQSIFSSVSAQRLVDALSRLDRGPARGRLRRIVDWINRTFFSGWEGTHEMGIDHAEEDEALFALTLNTPSVVLLVPYLDELPGLLHFDDQDRDERNAFLDFYEGSLRRRLYASGGDKTYLNKNALFAPRLRSMLGRFPDARFIYLIRHRLLPLRPRLPEVHPHRAVPGDPLRRSRGRSVRNGRVRLCILRDVHGEGLPPTAAGSDPTST